MTNHLRRGVWAVDTYTGSVWCRHRQRMVPRRNRGPQDRAEPATDAPRCLDRDTGGSAETLERMMTDLIHKATISPSTLTTAEMDHLNALVGAMNETAAKAADELNRALADYRDGRPSTVSFTLATVDGQWVVESASLTSGKP